MAVIDGDPVLNGLKARGVVGLGNGDGKGKGNGKGNGKDGGL